MEEQKKTNKIKWWIPVIVGMSWVVVMAGCCFIIYSRKAYELQQNVYFLEWDTKEDETIFYKYSSKDEGAVEVGKVEGQMNHCVINDEESCITGLCYDQGVKRVQYDLITGTVYSEVIGEKIDLLTGDVTWYALLMYDGGNKIVISYEEANGDEKWLFYDFTSEEYNMIEGQGSTTEFLEIDDNNLWYVSSAGRLYRYNFESGRKTEMLKNIGNAAVAVNTNLVAYIKDSMHPKKIYLYNLNTKKTRFIAKGGWNICYGNIFEKKGQWSNDGRKFFYVKYFPTFFSAADVSLMVYNTENGRTFCIYKEKNTLHQFRYIGHSG